MRVFVPQQSIKAGVCPSIAGYTVNPNDRTSADATVVPPQLRVVCSARHFTKRPA
jgi:hypothetical protein